MWKKGRGWRRFFQTNRHQVFCQKDRSGFPGTPYPPTPLADQGGDVFSKSREVVDVNNSFPLRSVINLPVFAVAVLTTPETNSFCVKLLSPQATLPKRASDGAAGYDLSSAVDILVPAFGKAMVSTDLAIATPQGTYARIAPRSGLAVKHFLAIGAGVVDHDFRGNIQVVIFNHSPKDFSVNKGDRIAQLILECSATPPVSCVSDLPSTQRNSHGFGSTGLSSLPVTPREGGSRPSSQPGG